MTHLSSSKIPRHLSTVARVQDSCSYMKIAHLTFCSSEFSPPHSHSSTNIITNIHISKKHSRNKSLRNGNFYQAITTPVAEIRNLVSVMVNQPCCKKKEKTLLKKMPFGSKKFRSVLLLTAISIIYASDIAVIKDVEAFTDPAYFSAVRFTVSAIPFLPFIFHARNDSHIRNSGLELGLWVSLGYLSEALGLVTSDACRASFISLFTVIVIPLLESMLGEIVPARTWFGILMSVLGISMLECSGSPPNIGDLFNFLSAMFFGIHTLRTEHISRTSTKENFMALLGYEVSVVALLSTIWCVMGANDLDGMSWNWAWFSDSMLSFPWIPALYTGVFSTGLCLWGEIAALRDVSATETAVIFGLEPVWGAGFAWFLLGERWGFAGWIGAALIMGGSLTVAKFEGSESESSDVVKKNATLTASEKNKIQKTLSASVVMVRSSSGDNLMDMFKK